MIRRWRWWMADKIMGVAVWVAGTEKHPVSKDDWYWANVR